MAVNCRTVSVTVETIGVRTEGSIFIGVGSGLSTVSVPLFLAEIAPPRIKKSLGLANQLFIVIGMLIGQSLSFPFAKYTKWRFVFAVPVTLAVVQLVASVAISMPQLKKDVTVATEEIDEEAPLIEQRRSRARYTHE